MKSLKINPGLFAQTCQLSAQLTYAIIGVMVFHGNRVPWHLPALLIFCALVETVFFYFYENKLRFPLMGLIAGASSFLLMTTRYTIYPYLLAGLIGVASKFLIRVDGKQIFNPSCLGLLCAICLLPSLSAVSIDYSEVDPWFYLILVSLGFAVAGMANKIPLALSYLTSSVSLAFIHFFLSQEKSLQFLVGRCFNATALIFAFHMITDPKTSPAKMRAQILFGISIAVLDYILHLNKISFARILSLAIVSALYPLMLKTLSFLQQKFGAAQPRTA